MNSNKNKDALLGMPHGTANNRLRKGIIFYLAGKANLLSCFRCGILIEQVKDLSIEHKNPWQQSNDPVKDFFDINNIAFSHLSCNCKASVHVNKKIVKFGFRWCWKCQSEKPKNKFRPTAGSIHCNVCEAKFKAAWRKRTGKH